MDSSDSHIHRHSTLNHAPALISLEGPLRGPKFGTFDSIDVAWLLDDYSALNLELGRLDRELLVQSGRGHYADILPVETPPDPSILNWFDVNLPTLASSVASLVATTAHEIDKRSSGEIVLISLVRAGVSPAIWLKRCLENRSGRTVHHYAVSILIGRGIDINSLAYIASHHGLADAFFVDGWTGKGTVRAELTHGVARAQSLGMDYHDRLAVLADPAGVADIAGSTNDILIPSACLNSTTSGLVSRSVDRQRRLGRLRPYHGAKIYWDLLPLDRSQIVVDAVSRLAQDAAVSPTPTGRSDLARSVVDELARNWTRGNVSLVKPGVGETIRVLQRRTPQRVLIDPSAHGQADLDFVSLLADHIGVPIEVTKIAPYRAVGIVKVVE